MRAISIALVMASFAACSVVTNLDELRSDASSDATDVTSDATNDVFDAGSVDADADASLEASSPFCTPYLDASLVYCQSFDSVTDAASILTIGGGSVANVDDADSVSAPNSLYVDLPADAATDGGPLHAFVTYAVSASPTHTTVDFEVKLLAPLTNQVNFASITIAAPSGSHALSLIALPTYIALQEILPTDAGQLYVNHPLVTHVFDDQWHAVHIELDLAAKRTTYAIDGITLEANYPLASGWGIGNASVIVGVTFAETPQAPTTVRTDNVLAQLAL